MGRIKIFVPNHLTGFFEICNGTSLLKTGSRGAGVCITKGVLTEITIQSSNENNIEVFINGNKDERAKVTLYVVNYYLKELKDVFYYIKINHTIDLPIGNGFGASGAGALGASFALNLLFNLNKTRNECAQIAHMAEVYNKTGLGDIIAQTFGGAEIRTEPGAPGYGELDNILVLPNLKVVCFSIGRIDTNSVIGNDIYKNNINNAGHLLVKELLKNPSISNLMRLSYKFAQESNLMPKEIWDILKKLHSRGYDDSSMVMLGKSLFCIVDQSNVKKVVDIIKKSSSSGKLFIADIDSQGARIIG